LFSDPYKTQKQTVCVERGILLLNLVVHILTHCGRVTQICVFTLQLCRTG